MLLILGGTSSFFIYRTARSLKKLDKKSGINNDILGKIEKRMAKPLEPFGNSENVSDWVFIATYKRVDLLRQTLCSIRDNEPDVKIIVVDNGSDLDAKKQMSEMHEQGIINKVLFNLHSETPQWQKSFAISQSLKLLSLEDVKSITVMDDDILVQEAWLQTAEKIINQNPKVKIVSMLDDAVQSKNHKTVRTDIYNGEEVKIRQTFNGAFFYMPIKTICTLGLPPIKEGFGDASVEDWYYSRIIKASDWEVAVVNKSKHLGYDESMRVNEQKTREQ